MVLTPDEAQRQGRVANTAWELMDGRDDVMSFLNDHDDELGGRPLDIAVASDAGLARVEGAMRSRTAARGRRMLLNAGIK